MRKVLMDQMLEVLEPPVYVYQTAPGGLFCDKLTLRDNGKGFQRKRYILTAGNACTCLGFMKTGKCKHLWMLSDEWKVKGVSAAIAMEEAERLVEVLKPQFPDSVKSVKEMFPGIAETMSVEYFQLDLFVDDPGDLCQITAIKKIPEVGTLGILLRVRKRDENGG